MVMLFAWAPAQANTAKKITVIHARMFSPTNQDSPTQEQDYCDGSFFHEEHFNSKNALRPNNIFGLGGYLSQTGDSAQNPLRWVNSAQNPFAGSMSVIAMFQQPSC